MSVRTPDILTKFEDEIQKLRRERLSPRIRNLGLATEGCNDEDCPIAEIICIAFSPDGRYFALGVSNSSYLEIWDTKTLAQIKFIEHGFGVPDSINDDIVSVRQIIFAKQPHMITRTLADGDEKTRSVENILVCQSETDDLLICCLSPDLARLEKYDPFSYLEKSKDESHKLLCFGLTSDDKKLVAVYIDKNYAEDGGLYMDVYVKQCDIQTWPPKFNEVNITSLVRIPKREYEYINAFFFPDGRRIIYEFAGDLRVVDIQNQKNSNPLYYEYHIQSLRQVCHSPNGAMFCAVFSNETIKVYDANDYTNLSSWRFQRMDYVSIAMTNDRLAICQYKRATDSWKTLHRIRIAVIKLLKSRGDWEENIFLDHTYTAERLVSFTHQEYETQTRVWTTRNPTIAFSPSSNTLLCSVSDRLMEWNRMRNLDRLKKVYRQLLRPNFKDFRQSDRVKILNLLNPVKKGQIRSNLIKNILGSDVEDKILEEVIGTVW